MNETVMLDVITFIGMKPEVLLIIALIGAVCVIGVVEYLRSFFEKKKNVIRWVVLFVSLFVAFIFSSMVPVFFKILIILWLFILSLSTIAKNYIINAIQKLVDGTTSKLIGSNNKQGGK